jgi:hypothetical protein
LVELVHCLDFSQAGEMMERRWKFRCLPVRSRGYGEENAGVVQHDRISVERKVTRSENGHQYNISIWVE